MPKPGDSPAPTPARSFWSGTITFGLVSIPVDFYAAARPRQKSMKMVDAQGHPLGRQYTREDDDNPLDQDDIIRGYETDDGKMVVLSDEEIESAAPEMSRDIELARFVPMEQIASAYFVRPYFLAPGARSGKAYALLAETMERTGQVAVGRFVMRSHEYLVAIIAEGGILRAETLRYHDELRTPEMIGLPEPTRPAKALVQAFAREIRRLREDRLDLHELEDRESEALQEVAQRKLLSGEDVVDLSAAEEEEPEEGGAEIVDLVQLLRRSLGGQAAAASPAPQAKAEPKRAAAAGDLSEKTRDELYEMASSLQISGRSRMNKAQLLDAVASASARQAA